MMSKLSFKTYCVELYADHKSIPSNKVYNIFDEKGIFKMLDEDYDLIHGLGFSFVINEIDQFLGGDAQ
jgi:hypothetical protein